jgi:O-antigen/teichoic acid export membrane protein
MISKFRDLFRRDGLKARALRAAFVSVMMSGGEHILRFASNLILTRLLFPEAFGLMAMVQVFLMGVNAVTTIGLRASVVQSPRGDDETFLNTIWTIQIARGILIYLIVVAFTPMIAKLYEQPILEQIMPVAALTVVINGFRTTKLLLVQRHIRLGLYAVLQLISQFIGLVCMSLLAWQLQSVWALVLGMLVAPVVANVLQLRYLPGPSNRLQFERESAREILKLGKYLFFSTIATYVIKQSDRAVLGLFIPVDLLGIYGIAFALATMPITLVEKFSTSIVFPLYRERHPMDAPENRSKMLRARRMSGGFSLALACFMAFVGPWLVEILYDDRYIQAGPITVLLCLATVPVIVLNGAMNTALSKGDSLRFMLMNVVTAACQAGFMYLGVKVYGIPGAAIAIAGAQLITYPLLVVFLRRYKSWDPLGDSLLMLGGFLMTGLAVWIHWDRILLLTG